MEPKEEKKSKTSAQHGEAILRIADKFVRRSPEFVIYGPTEEEISTVIGELDGYSWQMCDGSASHEIIVGKLKLTLTAHQLPTLGPLLSITAEIEDVLGTRPVDLQSLEQNFDVLDQAGALFQPAVIRVSKDGSLFVHGLEANLSYSLERRRR